MIIEMRDGAGVNFLVQKAGGRDERMFWGYIIDHPNKNMIGTGPTLFLRGWKVRDVAHSRPEHIKINHEHNFEKEIVDRNIISSIMTGDGANHLLISRAREDIVIKVIEFLRVNGYEKASDFVKYGYFIDSKDVWED